MDKVSQFIEKKLKLEVTREKSQVAKSDRVKFLGFTVVGGAIAISHKALQTAMSRVKELTPEVPINLWRRRWKRSINGTRGGQVIIH